MGIEYRITIEKEDGFAIRHRRVVTDYREVLRLDVELDKGGIAHALDVAVVEAEQNYGMSSNEAAFFRQLREAFNH